MPYSAPIHLGIIGLSTQGWASRNLAPPLLKAPLASQYRITAVCTTNVESAKASAQAYAAPKAYTLASVDDMISDDDIDMIAVSVNVRHHLHLAKKVLSAEKPKSLFVEWPAGVGLGETKELATLAKEKGVRSCVGLQARQSPVFRKLKAIVASGEIGTVLSTTMTVKSPPIVPGIGHPPWGPAVMAGMESVIQRENGSTMLDVPGGHFLDPFTSILGPIASVSATIATQFPTATVYKSPTDTESQSTIPQTAPNQVAVTGTLESGAVMSMHFRSGTETVTAVPFLWIIDGTKGTIRVENDHPISLFVEMFPPSRLILNDEKVDVLDDGKTNEGRAWEEFAKGGDYPDLDDALKIKAVIDAIWKSADEGGRVNVEY